MIMKRFFLNKQETQSKPFEEEVEFHDNTTKEEL